MINHGKRIFEIAQNKGLNKSKLASMLNKSHQAVDYDMKRQRLKPEVLDTYASVLQVNVSEFQVEIEENKNTDSVNWKEKYFESLEIINKLMLVVNQNGIKVNFKNVISLPRVGADIFFAHANTANNNYGL